MKTASFSLLVEEYLTLRRRLGYELRSQSFVLRDFARYTERIGHYGPLTIDLAVRWAQSSSSHDPANAARRLSILRGFARHRAAFDPTTEIPPTGLLGHATPRKPPHIYSDIEIAALLRAATTLAPKGGLRPHTYLTLFALLGSTGLRTCEARRLACRDVDLRAGVLTIRVSKFRKSRLVPLHQSAIEPLRSYAAHRDCCFPRSESFFRTEYAACLTRMAPQMTFRGLRSQLGWTAEGHARLPRIHDLRHTFAVRCLLRWYRQGIDIDRKIHILATYLGHARVAHTYWYLSAVPELMAIIAQRFERFAHREEGVHHDVS